MLKIYNAYEDHGEIKVEDYITFNYGSFHTGYDGFGEVHSGNLNCIRANYELQTLKSFKEGLKSIKTIDGWVQNFMIWSPKSYKLLAEEDKDIKKTAEAYEAYGLNEEAILLFTDFISLTPNDNLTQNLFGRCADTGLYLLMPNASIDMKIASHCDEDKENYEVLQSQSLGKRLILAKMNRRI